MTRSRRRNLASLNCPHCHQAAEYEVTWVVRTKKRQLSGRADERDRARFAKFRSYMVRKDDMMACKNMRCRKRFDLTGPVDGDHRVGGRVRAIGMLADFFPSFGRAFSIRCHSFILTVFPVAPCQSQVRAKEC